MTLTSFLLGRRLANRDAESRRIGTLEGLPAMGLDGLGSASYGPEAMLTVLAGTGAAGLAVVQPITWVILLLLATLFVSYWQTIRAYPSNGGSYIVARENLGERAALLAAAALMLDYMLNVAVGDLRRRGGADLGVPGPAAVDADAVPGDPGRAHAGQPARHQGVRRGARSAHLPVHLPRWPVHPRRPASGAGSGRAPGPVLAPPAAAARGQAVTLWLLLRAFAAGCTAMTGVEAVSNGVGAFKEPTVRYAHRTLFAIVAVLGLLLAGIAYPAHGPTALRRWTRPSRVTRAWSRSWWRR